MMHLMFSLWTVNSVTLSMHAAKQGCGYPWKPVRDESKWKNLLCYGFCMQILIYQKLIRDRYVVPIQGMKNKLKKKSLSITGLCKNTHHPFKLKFTEPRPLLPLTDLTATSAGLKDKGFFPFSCLLSGGHFKSWRQSCTQQQEGHWIPRSPDTQESSS